MKVYRAEKHWPDEGTGQIRKLHLGTWSNKKAAEKAIKDDIASWADPNADWYVYEVDVDTTREDIVSNYCYIGKKD